MPPEYEVGPDYGAPDYGEEIYHPGPSFYQPPTVKQEPAVPYGLSTPVPAPSLPVQNLPAVSWEDRQMQIVQELTLKATQPVYAESSLPGIPIVGQTSVYRVLAGVNAGETFYISERFPDGNVRAFGVSKYFADILRPGEYVQVS